MSETQVIHPVLLSGGSGTRLWPLSRSLHPKQLMKMDSDLTLLQKTALRFSGETYANPIIICNSDHRFLVAEQIKGIGIDPNYILLEPIARNTAPASILAALLIQEKYPKGLMLITPSDHLVKDVDSLKREITSATSDAEDGNLIVFGVVPDRPHTGYGYIKSSKETLQGGSQKVASFIEKPNLETAKRFFHEGLHYWNSGIFLCSAKSLIEKMNYLNPDMVEGCREALKLSSKDLDFLRLDLDAFSKIKGDSLDFELLEKDQNIGLRPIKVGWSDVGSWDTMWKTGTKDSDGNVLVGSAIAINSSNSYVRTTGPLVAVAGVENLIVVSTPDAVLVVPRSHSEDVRELVNEIEACGHNQRDSHVIVHRPWGFFEVLHIGLGYQVKKLVLKPSAAISLQFHNKRAEHWVVVGGKARIHCEGKEISLEANQSTYIPVGSKHRLTNDGPDQLTVIEVQTGEYLGEDDVTRLEDLYGRG